MLYGSVPVLSVFSGLYFTPAPTYTGSLPLQRTPYPQLGQFPIHMAQATLLLLSPYNRVAADCECSSNWCQNLGAFGIAKRVPVE